MAGVSSGGMYVLVLPPLSWGIFGERPQPSTLFKLLSYRANMPNQRLGAAVHK